MKVKASKQRKAKHRMLATLGLTLAAGGLALYFREKADNRYDRYRELGNPAEFNKFYDDAKKFDKFAAASFGVFQVSFVLSFYQFFKFVNN